jgi:hypothetical protein
MQGATEQVVCTNFAQLMDYGIKSDRTSCSYGQADIFEYCQCIKGGNAWLGIHEVREAHPFLSSYHHHPLGKQHLGLR